MVRLESEKIVIEIAIPNATPLDIVKEWKDLQSTILFLCANVDDTLADSVAVKRALSFLEELIPDDDSVLKMIQR